MKTDKQRNKSTSWISTTEKLPQFYESVLIVFVDHLNQMLHIDIAYLEQSVGFKFGDKLIKGTLYWDGAFTYDAKDVLYWMPLPALPTFPEKGNP